MCAKSLESGNPHDPGGLASQLLFRARSIKKDEDYCIFLLLRTCREVGVV